MRSAATERVEGLLDDYRDEWSWRLAAVVDGAVFLDPTPLVRPVALLLQQTQTQTQTQTQAQAQGAQDEEARLRPGLGPGLGTDLISQLPASVPPPSRAGAVAATAVGSSAGVHVGVGVGGQLGRLPRGAKVPPALLRLRL